MFKDYPDVLTVKQFAEASRIGINKAYELIKNNVIGYKRVGRKILIPKCCLIDYMQSAMYNVRA